MLEKITLSILALVIVAAAIISHLNEELFLTRVVVEDGPLEWLGALGFLLCAGIMLRYLFRLKGVRPFLFLLSTLGAALLFIFVFGEEISWGQRIFNVETPQWLEDKNRQSEMNLHNLEFGGVSINKLVFSKLLAVALVLYLLVTPFFYRRKPKFAALVDRLGIPMPQSRHIIVWLILFGFSELVVGTGKKGEVREFAAPFVLMLQLLYPLNHWIYRRGWKVGDDPG